MYFYAEIQLFEQVRLFQAEQHFTDVMVGEEFMALSLQQVCSLISSDKLTVFTEEKVTLPSLLSQFYLFHCASPHPLVSSSSITSQSRAVKKIWISYIRRI